MRKLELNINFYRKKSSVRYVKRDEKIITLMTDSAQVKNLTLVLENENGYKWSYPVSSLTSKAVCVNLDGFETTSFWIERSEYGSRQTVEVMVA
jgi:hypothetical protein